MKLKMIFILLAMTLPAWAGEIGESRIRLSLDLQNYDQATNNLTGEAPEIWRGMPTRIEVGIYDGGAFVTNLSDFVSVTLEIFNNSTRQGPAYLAVTQTNLAATLTESNWLAGAQADAHAVYELSQSQTAFDLSEAVYNEQQFFMTWYATTADTNNYILGSAMLVVHQTGASITPVLGSSNMNFRITAGGKLQLRNDDAATWHDIYLSGSAGAESIVISEGE